MSFTVLLRAFAVVACLAGAADVAFAQFPPPPGSLPPPPGRAPGVAPPAPGVRPPPPPGIRPPPPVARPRPPVYGGGGYYGGPGYYGGGYYGRDYYDPGYPVVVPVPVPVTPRYDPDVTALGDYCETPATTCRLVEPREVGTRCSCRVRGGRSRGYVVE